MVIPNHNNAEALRLTLEALSQQTYPAERFEVIVVDQASTDGSRELARTLVTPYELRLLEQDQKFGISVSRNGGMAAAQGSIVLILDADLIAAPGLIEGHDQMQHDLPGGLVCGRMLPYPQAYTCYIEKAADIDRGLDRGTRAGPVPFYQAFGGNLSLGVETYQQIGPWDPAMLRVQDIEFACRAEEKGVPIYYCPQALSYHNHARTLEERLDYVATIAWWPILYQRYPWIKGKVPWIRDFEPIEWGVDPVETIKNKSLNTMYGLKLTQWLFTGILMSLNHSERFPKVVRAVYWRLYSGTGRAAFRAGQRKLRREANG